MRKFTPTKKIVSKLPCKKLNIKINNARIMDATLANMLTFINKCYEVI